MRGDDYKFMQIADALSSLNQRVNLIGVAVESSIPETNGCFCAIRIIDESHPTGIRVHFFLETMKKLPSVKNVGDTVVVSNVLISRSKEYIYAIFNKRSTFALFQESSCADTPVPYQISTGYKICDEDIKSLVEIWKCSLAGKIEGRGVLAIAPVTTTMHQFSSQHFFLWNIEYEDNLFSFTGLHETVPMSKIQDGNSFNLICKILHIAHVDDENWMLFIWDGTDTPPVSIDTALESEMTNPLPLALEPLSRDMLCTFPSVGTVLMMTVDQEDKKLGIQLLKTNKWVSLINVTCQTKAALWSAMWTPNSRFYYLPDDHHTVIQYQRNYEERMQSKWLRKPITSPPLPSCITETSHPRMPLASLMDVLTYPKVVHKYRCIVRVVALLPCKPDDFRAPNDILRIRLTLEDPTARIHAYLYKEDGNTFFRGCRSEDEITMMRNKLVGLNGETVRRNPPWIDCCLKSFSTNETDVWGSHTYLIFDTWLL